MSTESLEEGAGPALRLSRHFDAPPEVVFRAWTDPAWLVRWMGPQECTCSHAETDLRVGGALKIAIRGKEGNDHWAHGVYQRVDPPVRLEFTWRWEEDGALGHEMLIALAFDECDGGTEFRLTQTKFATEESRDQHRGGWTGALDSLAEILPEFMNGQI